jgi:putative restriction endonuclease
MAPSFTHAYIANSDPTGWEFFRAHAPDGYVDEVNWWSPRATRPLTNSLVPGTLVFFRLTRPHGAVAGYGFFAGFMRLRLDIAWETFREGNGAKDFEHLLARVGNLRGESLGHVSTAALPDVGCHLLRDVHYWPRERWMPWGEDQGFHRNTVQGLTERDPARLALLGAAVAADGQQVPEELADRFTLLDTDEREVRRIEVAARVGQGTFRLRLLHAYENRCAITGEHTLPVLDAAHIQPYLGPRSNHPQNGLVLTKEFHTLFDRGYVTVEPQNDDYIVRVSPRLREDWNNGRRYYAYDGKPLAKVPDDHAQRPDREALAWHGAHRFLKAR